MYTMKQTCKKVGMTYEALKFYCNEGLVPNVRRDLNNRRVFDENDVLWITSLTCLKNLGMSIKDMKAYIDLCMQGQSTIPERKTILNELKESLQKKWTTCGKASTTLIISSSFMMMCFPEKQNTIVT
ncbi:Transcriptional regulator, MerR family [Desulfosporosinus sp. I2]|uniref:MerR family transcriptional regulator n=1 Tax=Desulfosporosinus sp. I2 TaxID=1617025 RepID=UPI00061E6B04|nr:Transcriptional regulator, MerR family [Desulfosporosinus sp. I2]